MKYIWYCISDPRAYHNFNILWENPSSLPFLINCIPKKNTTEICPRGPAHRGPARWSPAGRGPAGRGPANQIPACQGPAWRGSNHRGPARRGPARRGPARRGPARCQGPPLGFDLAVFQCIA